MKFKAHFYLLNEHFSQEHADAHHEGKESENNPKTEWEDELALKNEILHYEILRNSSYFIRGTYGNNETFSYEVKSMFLIKIVNTDKTITEMACSEVAVDSYELIEGEDIVVKVFMKGEEPTVNPIPGIYIANLDFPTELVNGPTEE